MQSGKQRILSISGCGERLILMTTSNIVNNDWRPNRNTVRLIQNVTVSIARSTESKDVHGSDRITGGDGITMLCFEPSRGRKPFDSMHITPKRSVLMLGNTESLTNRRSGNT